MKKKKVKAPKTMDFSSRYMGKTEKKKFKMWLKEQSIRDLIAKGVWRWTNDLAHQNGIKATDHVKV